MALPAVDNFNTGTSALSAGWENNLGNFTVIANELAANGADQNVAYWGADAFNNDHYSQITIKTVVTDDNVGPAVRCSGTTAYILWCDVNISYIQKIVDGGMRTFLHSFGVGVVSGDVLKLEVVGTTLRYYKNGSEVGSGFTDASIASGAAGVFGFRATGRFDDFLADNITTSVTAVITGTGGGGMTEAEVVAGGKTLIITLTNDTWVAAGATFDAQRQNIINGLNSAQSEATGFNALRSTIAVTAVVRTSSTVATVTLPALGTFNITANETLTETVPASALTGAAQIIATPQVVVTVVGGVTVPQQAGIHMQERSGGTMQGRGYV